MSVIEKNISQFIQNQFPAIYREEGENFVEFVKQYYEWMEESNNVIYHSRRQLEYKDIDDTVEDFLVMFKNKYLADIQLDTATQTRKLVKNSLDLYRAKGTERSVGVFFRSIFGVDVEVYYPGDDIFRLSDGRWVKPMYLEVTSSAYNKEFVNKQIQGVSSGATAFVERYIRRKIKSKYIDVLYISALNGDFETNEQITLQGQNLKGTPKVVGSLNSMQIIAGGANFAIGDIVTLNTDNGVQGKGRVAGVSNLTGTVDFQLNDYGWGYTADSQILVSEKVLYLQNVRTVTSNLGLQFNIFETIKQPLANITISNANNNISGLANGTMLYTYYSNNTVAGVGRVMGFTPSGTTAGEIYVAEIKNTLGTVIEPSANLTGTVSVTQICTPIGGVASISNTSNAVVGTTTAFTTDLKVGAIVKIYAFNSTNGAFIGSEFKKIGTITDTTHLTFTTNASFTTTNVSIEVQGGKIITGTGTTFTGNFVYGDIVAIYSNSTNYYLHSVNAVTNSTYMTLQSDVAFVNTAANFAKVTYANTIYVGANTSNARIDVRTDKSVTGNVIGVSANLVIYTKDQTAIFSPIEYIYQLDQYDNEIARAKISSVRSTVGTNSVYSISNSYGVFVPGSIYPVRTRYANGLPTGKTATLTSVDLTVGVYGISSAFVNTSFNYVTGVNSSSNATITRISGGVLANFGIANTMQYSESVYIGSEQVNNYLNIKLDAFRYGFLHLPSANQSTQYIADCFENKSFNFGSISSLVSVNPGKNYDAAPFILIYEPLTAQNKFYDYLMYISNPSAIFKEGEIITQSLSAGGNTSGLVKTANSTQIFVRRIHYANQFEVGRPLTGAISQATATMTAIIDDTTSLPMGINSVVLSNVQSSTGSVTKLEVYDSGFGYVNNESATFTSTDGTNSGLARLALGKQGQSEGFFTNRKGQLSDSKYIFDGEYYQDYSYEIRSPLSPDKYKEMLKKVIHVAGTKSFSATYITNIANTSPNVIAEISLG
jgi:hypothetical protein